MCPYVRLYHWKTPIQPFQLFALQTCLHCLKETKSRQLLQFGANNFTSTDSGEANSEAVVPWWIFVVLFFEGQRGLWCFILKASTVRSHISLYIPSTREAGVIPYTIHANVTKSCNTYTYYIILHLQSHINVELYPIKLLYVEAPVWVWILCLEDICLGIMTFIGRLKSLVDKNC